MDYELLIAQESTAYDNESDPTKREKILKSIKTLQEMQAAERNQELSWKDDRTLTPKERFAKSLSESGPQVVAGIFALATAAFGFATNIATCKSNERIAEIRESGRLAELKMLTKWEEETSDIVSDRNLKTVNELNK